MQKLILVLVVSLGLFSCSKPVMQITSDDNPAQQIINRAIKAHGGNAYNPSMFEFTFRKGVYSFSQQGGQFHFTVAQTKNGKKISAALTNDNYERWVEGIEIELSEKDKRKYGDALNSVIYFALLPYRLNDSAVKKIYRGTQTIKGKSYDVVEVRFSEKNGGTDYDDEFRYWINEETNTLDYLAYSYQVNGGGVRFRNAYNARNVNGVRFQDYENYKAPVGTALKTLPQLFESGALKLLSKIELVNIKSLK